MPVTIAEESQDSVNMQEKHERWNISSLLNKVDQIEAAVECLIKMLTEAGFSAQNVLATDSRPTANGQDADIASLGEDNMHANEHDTPDRSDIYPDIYDGTTSWSNYLLQFELIAEFNNWNDHDKAIHLAVNLKGVALGVLNDVDSGERHHFQSLVTALNLRFGHENQEELFWMKLNNRVRSPNETLPELAHDIRTMVKIVFPTMPDSFSQELAKKYFVKAIQDSRIRLNIVCAKPTSLNAAIQIAVETEAFYKADELRTCHHGHVESKTIVDLIDDITKEIGLYQVGLQVKPKTAKRKSPSAQRRAWKRRATR